MTGQHCDRHHSIQRPAPLRFALNFVARQVGRSGLRPSLAAVLIASATIAGCAHKPAMTGPVVAPVGSFVQSWIFPLGWNKDHDSIRSLYVRGDVLYVYSERNTVVALTPSTGRALYAEQVNPGGIQLEPPVVVKDKIAFPSANTIDIYDKSGKEVDHVSVDHSIRSPGIAGGDVIYLGLDYPSGGRLAAIDLSRKFDRVKWEMMTPDAGISAGPAYHANTIYAASDDGRVYAIGEDRSPVWPLDKGSYFQTDGKVSADIKADDTGVYAASTDTKLYCLELATGKIKWQYYATVPLTKSPVLTATMVYLPVDSVGVVALAKTEGKFNREAKWIIRDATQVLSEDDTYAYLLSGNGLILAVDKATGKVRFTSHRKDLVAFATNINPKDATIYAATAGGAIIAIRPINKPGVVGEIVRNSDWLETAVAFAN